MSMATLDQGLIPILESATERIEIKDKNGELIGIFEPNRNRKFPRQSPYSVEEIRDVIQNKGKGLSLDEVLKKIGAE